MRTWTFDYNLTSGQNLYIELENQIINGGNVCEVAYDNLQLTQLASKLVITGSGTQTAGGSQNLTITAEYPDGSTATTYTGSHSLTFSGANSSGNPVTAPTVISSGGTATAFGTATAINFVNGVATVSSPNNGVMTLYKAETAAISATDGTISSSGTGNLSVTVSPGAIDHYVISSVPSPQNATVAFNVTVTAKDQFGNTVTTDNSTQVTMSSSTGHATFTSGPTFTLSSGTFTVSTTDSTIETVNIAATDPNGKTGTLTGLVIRAAPASGDYRTRGNGGGNWTGTTTWQTFSSGAWANTSGNPPQSSTEAITILSGDTVTLTAGLANPVGHLVVQSGGTIAGANFLGLTGSGTALDIFGTVNAPSSWAMDAQTVVENGGSLTVSASDHLLLRGTLTIAGGTVTTTSGTGFIGNGSDTLNMTAGLLSLGGGWTPDTVSLTGGTVQFAGGGQSVPTVTYYNVEISGSQNAVLSGATTINGGLAIDSGSKLNLGAGLASTAKTLSFAGSQQVSGLWGYSSTHSSTTYFANNTGTVNVNQGPETKLVMKTEPSSSVTAGALFSTEPAVNLEDASGNVETTDNSTVVTATVGTGTGPLTGTLTATAVNGVATFSALAAPTLAQSGLKLTFTATGLTSAADTTSITVNKATPTFSGLTASPIITYGTATVTLSGTVSAPGPVYAANVDTVNVTINSSTQPATIAGGAGGFSINFPTASIPASGTAYTITYAYAGDANLNAAANNTSTTLTVNKATPTVTVTVGSYTYSGSAQGPNAFTTSPSGDTGTPTWSYVGVSGTTYGPSATPPTLAGSYTAQVTALTSDANFNASSSSATAFTIGKVTPTVTVTVGSYTYTGSAQGPNAFTTSPSGDTGTPTWTYVGTGSTTYSSSSTPPTGAGTYNATASVTADANFNAASSSATAFTIGKASPTVTVTPYTVTYDGSAHTATVTSITGVNGETGATVGTVSLSTTHTAAGTYSSDSWSFTGTANYNNIGSTTITDTINQRALTFTGSKTYDGNASATAAQLTFGNNVDGVNLTKSGSVTLASANAGSENISSFGGLTLAGSAAPNYTLTGASGAVTVGKATATVVVTPYTVTYDGSAHTATVTSITGVNGETGATVGTVSLTTTHTVAGTYSSDSWSFTGTANYNNIGSTTITDTINQRALTFTGSKTYDGNASATAVQLTFGNNVDGVNLTKSGSVTLASKNTGSESIISFAGLSLGGSAAGNYTLTGASGSVQITPSGPPVGGTQYLTTVVNTALNVSASTLAGLNYDPDGTLLTITGVNSPSTQGGTVGLSSGTITYTPAANYVGADQFTYTISDGFGGTATGTADVTVTLGKATSVFNYVSGSSGTVNLRGYGIPGKSYDIQRCGNANFSTTITVVATVTAAASGVILYTDTGAPSPSFYRFAVH